MKESSSDVRITHECATALPLALDRLAAMDRTGLAQAFSVADGRAVLAHIAAIEGERDKLVEAARRHLAHAPCDGGSAEYCGLAELVSK